MQRGASALVWASAANRVLTAGTQVVVGFMLQPEQLGEFALAMALVGLLCLFQAADLSRVALQFGDRAADVAGRLRNLLLLGCALSAVAALAAAMALDVAVSPWMLLPLTLLPLLRVMNNTRVALLSRRGAVGEVAGVAAAEGLSRALCVVALALAGMGPLALVAGEVVAMLVAAAWLARLERTVHAPTLQLPEGARTMLVQAAVSSHLTLAEREFPVWLAGALCGVAAAGHFAFAARIAGQLQILLVPLLTVEAVPALLRAWQQGRGALLAERRVQALRLLRWGVSLSLLLGLAVPAVMVWVWSDRWRLAAVLTPVLVATVAVRMATALSRAELEATGRYGDILRLAAWDGGAMLLLLPAAAWVLGVEGLVGAMLVLAAVAWWRARRQVQQVAPAPRAPGA